LHHYSCGMVSEFHQLSEKISQLADLAQSLRRENAELRLNMAALTAENAELTMRIQEAYQRVSALLDKIPTPDAENNEEAA
jgi:cell division protein ZapB